MYTSYNPADTRRRRRLAIRTVIITLIAVSSASAGCSKGSDNNHKADSDTIAFASDETPVDKYDIAMAVSSITDAISVGEPLDTAEYNFEGILTDGRGTPLYTDIQGAPGRWQIDVVDNHSVRIRNVYIGDLVPDSLTKYIVNSLALSDRNLVKDRCTETDDSGCIGSDYPTSCYNFGGGFIEFSTKSVQAPGGDIGPLFCITISSAGNPERHGRNT